MKMEKIGIQKKQGSVVEILKHEILLGNIPSGTEMTQNELAVVQEELQQKKQITDGTEILLTTDNLQQYVKKIEVDREKITCTEFAF